MVRLMLFTDGNQINRKNSGKPHRARCARAIPSRAAHGCAEGVETRRWRCIERRKTPQASGAGNGEDIVRSSSNGRVSVSGMYSRIGQVGLLVAVGIVVLGDGFAE